MRVCTEHFDFTQHRLVEVLAIVDVRYFVDNLLEFKWAFKKLPKSIPEALKKVPFITVISKEYFDVAQHRLREKSIFRPPFVISNEYEKSFLCFLLLPT